MTECILCGGKEFKFLYSETLKKCKQCGFVSANMEISDEILKSTYNVNYFKGEEYLDYQKDKPILQLNFLKRIKQVEKLAGNKEITNCLEIGCAYGFFGEVLLKRWQTKYKGIDVVPEIIRFSKEKLGLDVLCTDYLTLPAPETPYSDVFMWDVIEHLAKPQEILKKISAETVTGSRIYITTGDISALLPRIQGKKWRMIHPPSHIHYFSKNHLNLLLNKTGFKMIHFSYPPVYRSLKQIFYSLFLLNKTGKVATRLFNMIPSKWNVPVNTFDIMLMIAVKK